MLVTIIDYGSGNLRSATKAFERASNEAGLKAEILLTDKAEDVARADRIVLPGVGAYADCRLGLDNVPNMVEVLQESVIRKARPFLGICVGTQLMAERGMEKTTTDGLGWINGDVVEIKPDDPALKIPQIGWNTLSAEQDHPLLQDVKTGPDGLHAYFVHSFHIAAKDRKQVIATSDYGGEITAIVGKDNMVGTQFHPEKSQKLGLALITNFLKWTP